MCTDRILVHSSIATKFTNALKSALEAKSKGTPEWPTIVNTAAKERAESQVSDAVAAGAEVIYSTPKAEGSSDASASGIRVPQVVLGNVGDHMEVWQEESFAPVATVRVFQDEEEAVRLANDGGYGLTASIFTEDLRKAFALARKIQSG